MSPEELAAMRFAYIDSQGNEVAIPSVDALALRIELGAISPETQLYDAQSDRWAPAESHEIFHTLSRDVAGETFLVPTPPPAPEESHAEPPEGGSPPPEEATELHEQVPSDPQSESTPPTSPEPTTPASADDLGLTLAPGPGSLDEEAAPEDAGADRLPMLEGAEEGVGDGTDDVDGGMAPVHRGGEPSKDRGDGFDILEGDPEEADALDSGLDLEPAMEFGPPDEGELEGGLDLEPPMSDFDPTSPPAWMEQDGPGGLAEGDEPLMDFSAGIEESLESEDVYAEGGASSPPSEVQPSPAPRPRPAPARPPTRRPIRRKRSAKPFLLILFLGALGVGGWYGWQQFGGRFVPEPPRPPVVIPDIPVELEPPMRDLADAALPRMFERLQEAAFGADVPDAPSEEWLAGIYLGNASRFGAVEAFWTGVRGFADRLQNEELMAFHDAYVALADSSDLGADVVPILVERADSGFMATRDARLQTYSLLRSLAGAALGLHDFLVEHEGDIAYTPARGFSGNPIEEAVPATDELGREMWDLVAEITNALDRLGTLDRVTRQRLNAVVLARIQEIGIR